MSKRFYSAEDKFNILKEWEDGNYSLNELESIFKVSRITIYRWKYKFENYGTEGLKRASSWKKYSKELKLSAIKDYLSGEYSLREVTRKYEISDDYILRMWIKKYNSHSKLNNTTKGRINAMTKGRKTTLDERRQIVHYCLKNNKDFQTTAETFQVSYQQVYRWVRNYEVGGEEALKDNRGKKKEEAELTLEQKMKLEMQRLKKENERLCIEKCFPKKVRENRKEAKINQLRLENKYIAIQELHQNEEFPIVILCEIAGIARSAYYKWQNRTFSNREEENVEIINEIKSIHDEVKGIFGYRRMTLNLNRRFKRKVNHKRVYRLMKISGIQSVIRKKKKHFKKPLPHYVAENILNREFKAEKPNKKWVTDVTELKYGESKKAYLSAIRDLYDGSIISYVLGHSNNNKLVFATLDQATGLLNGEHPLIHSDRGFQYTHRDFKQRVDKAAMTHSMSRVGRCIDNSPMESFWGTLKSEKYYLEKYKTFEQLSTAINEYIHFYNHDRYQKKLNGLSPIEYRAKIA
ncbi:IS3 family transposase [Bacillus sp. TL12]|uniref:IS3 family transposase n=1 Tax=Bacillus sp. TL12 TaxID=2894756 RepID=UPI001F52072B|nr:IS3 family transposase [Bacillus sp. TL12]MCI0768511.1 IS3 family transposase [Bacillus sp. TL12]